MAVACAFRKRSAIARVQYSLAAIFDQHQFAFEYVDEFVFMRMPVALARPITWRQAHETDTEISEPAVVTQLLTNASAQGASNGDG